MLSQAGVTGLDSSMLSVTGGPESPRFGDGKGDGWLPEAGSGEWGTAVSKTQENEESYGVDDGDNGCTII